MSYWNLQWFLWSKWIFRSIYIYFIYVTAHNASDYGRSQGCKGGGGNGFLYNGDIKKKSIHNGPLFEIPRSSHVILLDSLLCSLVKNIKIVCSIICKIQLHFFFRRNAIKLCNPPPLPTINRVSVYRAWEISCMD